MSAIFGETLLVEQDNGTDAELVVWGDEFYVRYETPSGYTACRDPKSGCYCYADVRNGRLVSTGAAVCKPPPIGLRRHLQESVEVQRARFEARYNQLRPEETVSVEDGRFFTIGRNQGLLTGRRVSQGNVLGLTILVEFTDLAASVSAADVDALLNADNYSANGNFCSVREYFHIVSNGKLNYRNNVVGPITLSHTKKHYETTSFVPEAFQLAMAQLDADGVDLGQFDSRNDGTLDALNFMYAGRTVYGINGNDDNPSELWPHNSTTSLRHGALSTHFYMLSSMGRRAVDLSIGTFCHESAHLLCRFPDLYDYGKRDGDSRPSRGIGQYCLMGSGNHLNHGRTPSPVCAYLRDLVHWADDEVSLNGPGSHSAQHGNYGQVMKYQTPTSNEYFLIENRSQLGLDQHLPSSGLAIYHCDITGSNELQQGTAARHYQVALLQADGRLDLESNQRSDAGDLYGAVNGIAMSHDTLPPARMWDGSDSGLLVAGISAPGQAIDFQVGEAAAPGNVTGEVVAHQLIPDDNTQGISSVITIAEQGALTRVAVAVDITHSFIGDLEISLDSPAGQSVILHNRKGGSDHDIQTTYSDANAPLAGLNGEEIAGDWTLRVRDLAGQDVGRLNRWSIDIDFEASAQTAGGNAQPNLAIPDNTAAGVASAIAIAEQGQLTSARVHVEIEHTYIGDLHVELVAPSGQGAVLHNRTGSSSHDLRTTYDHSIAPALDVLIDQAIQGDWTLRIRDLANIDTGTLESWSLELRYGP